MVWAPESESVGCALELLSHRFAVLEWLPISMPAWLVVYFLCETHFEAARTRTDQMAGGRMALLVMIIMSVTY